jgi:hypothetical protein
MSVERIQITGALYKQSSLESLHLTEKAETMDERIRESCDLLMAIPGFSEISIFIDKESFILGTVPRLSPFDIQFLPPDVKLVRVPDEYSKNQQILRSYDLINWNNPDKVFSRLRLEQKLFKPPIPGNSAVMERFSEKGGIVSFNNLRVKPPSPTSERKSRKERYCNIEVNLMGRARIPLALGSVPDIGSALAYITMAQANGLVFVSRDKILTDIDRQVDLVKVVIDVLNKVSLPAQLLPNKKQLEYFWQLKRYSRENYTFDFALNQYTKELRQSWVDNVGAAIETSPGGILRAKKLYQAGCRLFRVYSPEGGLEIPKIVAELRGMSEFSDRSRVKIVAGQIMDVDTAIATEKAGSDAIIIGVAGGSQCTTAVNADIPVNTPNLLYQIRGKVNIPIGIEGGGVGTHIMTAFSLGASFLCKPGEIGLSLEGAGGEYILQDKKGNFWMLYGGEASDAAKWWRGSIDAVGRPRFVEGEGGIRRLSERNLYMTNNIHHLLEQISIGLVFQRAADIEELHQRDCSNIVEVTPAVAALSQAYGE